MMCGGLNGCPMRTRSGCLHLDCMTLGVMPDELDAMSESTGVASSMSANSLILKSGRSGPFSWTKSALERASFMLVVKLSRSREAPAERPMLVSIPHASSTYFRRLASAFGAGSVATTSSPRARYWAAQLAPMTPVPTMATRRIGFLKDMSHLRCRDVSVCNASQVALSHEQHGRPRAVEPRRIDRAAQVGHEHPTAFEVECDADAFHQVGEQNLRGRTPFATCIHGSAIHRVAPWRIAAVGPVDETVLAVELDVDRLGEAVVEHLDVLAGGGTLPLGDVDPRATEPAQPGIVRPLVGPVDVAPVGIDRDSHAPLREVSTIGVSLAGLHQRLDL